MNKTYLGDGVYANFDGYYLWITTEDGRDVTNSIALEASVWNALQAFAKGLTI